MANDEQEFQLPKRVDSHLATLNRFYEQAGETTLREIVVNGVVSIEEGRDYDNWNGGIFGHAITLTLPEDTFPNPSDQIDFLVAHPLGW